MDGAVFTHAAGRRGEAYRVWAAAAVDRRAGVDRRAEYRVGGFPVQAAAAAEYRARADHPAWCRGRSTKGR
jgi:hypothetical protein